VANPSQTYFLPATEIRKAPKLTILFSKPRQDKKVKHFSAWGFFFLGKLIRSQKEVIVPSRIDTEIAAVEINSFPCKKNANYGRLRAAARLQKTT
jgi:hypothetical protein